MTRLAVVGAGFSGAVVARELAEAGHRVSVFEARDTVAGNCHTERDPATGVLIHVYGPHIFHTRFTRVWDHVRRFGEFVPYQHKVRTTVGDRVFGLPVDLLTINQFVGTAMSPSEARAFLAARQERDREGETFEDQALRMVGRELYEAFFRGYTTKQWGRSPTELPASVFSRLPVRFHYDDRYFDHPFQAMPVDGYTPIVEAMLDHPGIDVHLGHPVSPAVVGDHLHTFWSGPIDAYFEHRLGRLPYRTLRFQHEHHPGDYQGCPVMNYGDESVPYTRITEHRHFAPWEEHDATVITREYSAEAGVDDIPYYPVRLARDQEQLAGYTGLARVEPGVAFLGRLGSYRYLDMDVTINEALDVADHAIARLAAGDRPRPFVHGDA